jgi:prepilin-type N-terminal cleavage/methylation domain-containing protein
MHRKAFTLLELLIVIIIVGVLASLALPRFSKMVELARTAEAKLQMRAIRDALERYYLMKGSYGRATGWGQETCGGGGQCDWEVLGIENPTENPGSHFDYDLTDNGDHILARRNTLDGGLVGDRIVRCEVPGVTAVAWCGDGRYVGPLPKCPSKIEDWMCTPL